MEIPNHEQDGRLKITMRRLNRSAGHGTMAACSICEFQVLGADFGEEGDRASEMVLLRVAEHLLEAHGIIGTVDSTAVLSEPALKSDANQDLLEASRATIAEAQRLRARYRVIEEELQWIVDGGTPSNSVN